MTTETKPNYTIPFLALCVLLFMVGFVQFINSILVDFMKKVFDLTNSQSQLVSFMFFLAYFTMALPAQALLKRFGYKVGMVFGLAVCGAGAILFLPAASSLTYAIFLIAIGILGTGVTILQVAANPYAAILGSPETSAARVNIANGATALGSMAAPYVGGTLILAKLPQMEEGVKQTFSSEIVLGIVQTPYLLITGIFVFLASAFTFLKLPENLETTDESKEKEAFSLAKYPQLLFGIIAIFVYLGAQISLINTFNSYLNTYVGISLTEAPAYLSFFFFLQMVGRFTGPAVMNSGISTGRLLALSGMGMIAVITLISFLPEGSQLIAYALVLAGLFDAVCFGNVFAIAIKGLGSHTKLASSLIFMAVVGGAIFPILTGYITDSTSLKVAYIVPFLGYAYLIWYGSKKFDAA